MGDSWIHYFATLHGQEAGGSLWPGDCHGRFDHVIEVAQVCLPAAVVFLGDMEVPAPLHEVLAPITAITSIWWIPGNHDTDSEASHDHLQGSALAGHNLHGRVV